MAKFVKLLLPSSTSKILDVGGTPFNWNYLDGEFDVTLLNIHEVGQLSTPQKFKYVKGDGTNLTYGDGEFNICFSNSVIEHLETFERQEKFAKEVRRVGKSVWVQTPAKSFFVEPHLVTPFIHYLPKKVQRRFLRNFTIWGLYQRPSQKDVDQFLAEVRLLTYVEMQTLFPDCIILVERFLGIPKAYIAVRK